LLWHSVSKPVEPALTSLPTILRILVNACLLSELGKSLDEQEEPCIANGLCGLDLIHLAAEGGPTHALGLVDGIADAAICSEAVPALKA
jgi:hypothetical protein